MNLHQLLELADLEEDVAAVSRVPRHTQLNRLPGIFMLFAVVESAGELCIPVPICNAPTTTATVFYLPSETVKPPLLSHVRRKFPMRRIMRRNGQTWDYPARTACADCCPQTLENPGYTRDLSMEPSGFEPLTPCMPCRCSTS